MLYLRHFILLTLLSIPCANVIASPEAWWINAQGSLLDFNYREYSDQGNLLDKESGILPGLIFGMGKNQGQWRFAGKLSCHAGDATYSGQTNGGVPISTVTKQLITDMELRVEYSFSNDASIFKELYLGVAQHYWKRDIQPIGAIERLTGRRVAEVRLQAELHAGAQGGHVDADIPGDEGGNRAPV